VKLRKKTARKMRREVEKLRAAGVAPIDISQARTLDDIRRSPDGYRLGAYIKRLNECGYAA